MGGNNKQSRKQENLPEVRKRRKHDASTLSRGAESKARWGNENRSDVQVSLGRKPFLNEVAVSGWLGADTSVRLECFKKRRRSAWPASGVLGSYMYTPQALNYDETLRLLVGVKTT